VSENSSQKKKQRVVVDDDGKEYVLHGFGWALDYGPLNLDPRLDLTKPIWEQVQRLDRIDAMKEKREQKRKAHETEAAA
jgi:hypothetical protein